MTNKRKTLHTILSILGILLIILLISSLFVDVAMARPGGGNSYSGGGSSSGGGGGGSGIAGLVIWLILQLPPQISIPLLIIIAIGYFIYKRKSKKNASVTSTPTFQNRTSSVANREQLVKNIKTIDANFSKVLFLEFVGSLFNKYYSYQGTNKISTLSPFLDQKIIDAVKGRNVSRTVNEIVIGTINIGEINVYSQIVAVTVDINANFTVTVNGKGTRYEVSERWLLNRKKGILSQEPEKMQKLACPNCGAAANFSDAGKCQHCDTFIEKGTMQWFVKDRKVITQRSFKTSSLLTYAQEIGTNYPTVYQPSLSSHLQQIAGTHNTNWDGFWNTFKSSTVIPYFKEIYNLWTQQRWDKVRHLVADRLWESNNFWIEAYKRASLINKLDNLQITKLDVARVDVDKFYEAITVRIYANCLDYVTDRTGQVKAGSNKRARHFSEYWTFIRRNGVEKDSFDLSTCPNCGAPADKMGQAGDCEYCGTKVTSGNFSWVLAIITQDEEYKG